eukprot:jgi/Mesvir1/22600/Mv17188-RA.1
MSAASSSGPAVRGAASETLVSNALALVDDEIRRLRLARAEWETEWASFQEMRSTMLQRLAGLRASRATWQQEFSQSELAESKLREEASAVIRKLRADRDDLTAAMNEELLRIADAKAALTEPARSEISLYSSLYSVHGGGSYQRDGNVCSVHGGPQATGGDRGGAEGDKRSPSRRLRPTGVAEDAATRSQGDTSAWELHAPAVADAAAEHPAVADASSAGDHFLALQRILVDRITRIAEQEVELRRVTERSQALEVSVGELMDEVAALRQERREQGEEIERLMEENGELKRAMDGFGKKGSMEPASMEQWTGRERAGAQMGTPHRGTPLRALAQAVTPGGKEGAGTGQGLGAREGQGRAGPSSAPGHKPMIPIDELAEAPL